MRAGLGNFKMWNRVQARLACLNGALRFEPTKRSVHPQLEIIGAPSGLHQSWIFQRFSMIVHERAI